jgi:hypothetical protein
VFQGSTVYSILENTPSGPRWKNISQCHLGKKYEKGREKGGKCQTKRKEGENKEKEERKRENKK